MRGLMFKPQWLGWRFVSHLVEDLEMLVRKADFEAQCREGFTQANARL